MSSIGNFATALLGPDWVMARPPDPKRRQELLDGAVDYVVANGISDLSLRPLALALGTQAPVLLHHFGTKEHLVEEMLGRVRDRLRAPAAAPRQRLIAQVWEPCGRGCLTPTKVR